MKISSSISFVVLIGLVCLIQITLSQQCVEYLTPLKRDKTKVVDCPMVTFNDKRQEQPKSDNMFKINFSCPITNKTLCDQVNDVFVSAGKFISATLNLKSVIIVDAQFLDLCESTGACTQDKTILGAAGPARLIPYQDPKDNKMRLYPQALFKQLNIPEHPEFGPNDIKAVFNSNMTYWFDNDPLPMLDRQVDLLYIVLHELIHGLGITTAWNDYANLQALTPLFGPSLDDGPFTKKGQFLELITDKQLVLFPSGESLTSITDKLNEFQFTLDMTDDQIITSFKASPQFQIAQDLYKKAMTQGSMGWLLTDLPQNNTNNTKLTLDDVAISETSLVPYQPSSSIAHFDLKTYLNSSDFLMIFTYPKTKTLGDMMLRAKSTNTTGPIGPKLRKLLGVLGYEVNDDYTPPITNLATNSDDGGVIPSTSAGPDTPVPSPNNNKTNNSSLVSFNLGLSLICLLLTFTSNIYFKY